MPVLRREGEENEVSGDDFLKRVVETGVAPTPTRGFRSPPAILTLYYDRALRKIKSISLNFSTSWLVVQGRGGRVVCFRNHSGNGLSLLWLRCGYTVVVHPLTRFQYAIGGSVGGHQLFLEFVHSL